MQKLTPQAAHCSCEEENVSNSYSIVVGILWFLLEILMIFKSYSSSTVESRERIANSPSPASPQLLPSVVHFSNTVQCPTVGQGVRMDYTFCVILEYERGCSEKHDL